MKMDGSRKPKVLIVDDTPESIQILMETLRNDYTIVAAINGEKALKLALTDPVPDIILLDIVMPDMDGFEVCKRLKEDRKTRDIPIVFITVLTDEQEEDKGLKLGAVDYITKPFSSVVVKTRIRNQIELRRMRLDLESLVAERTTKLKEEKEFTEAALDAQADTFFVFEPETGKAIRWNKAFSEISGYTDEEIQSMKTPDSFYSGTDLERASTTIKEISIQGQGRVEMSLITKSGKEILTEYIASLVKDKKGNPKYIIAVGRDITERKQAENDLKSRTHDLGERVKELHCLYNISKIAEEVDLSLEETTQRIVNLIPPTWQYPDITCARIILRGKEFKTEDFETSVWGQTSDISVYGKRIGTVEVYYSEEKATDFEGPFLKEERDLIEAISERLGQIIERKQAEEEKQKLETQLVQAQKMEAIGTLAGGIAHDFNNILMGILGHADLAKMKLAEDSEAIDNLNQLKNAGNRAKRLIQQILAFGRMGEQEKIPLSLTPLIKEALKFLRSTLPTSIEIRDYIEADPGIIEADATQIHQIVMNLCTNAGHAMGEEGGTLDVKLIRVEVDRQTASQHHELHDGPHVRLTVTDTGCGMDSETLEHIFDPYFTTKEVGEGTGLGLSVVHGIVKTHGGAITVESEPEKGTTFHVYFPVIEKDAETQEEDEGPLPTGNERILFVDDEQMILDIGKGILGELGYDVITKKCSVEGLELFRAEPDRVDLIITDMTMPKMTGDQLARELMKVRPDIPIIICTGFSPKISEEQAKEIGIKAFAMKPLVRRNMANVVRKVLDVGRSEADLSAGRVAEIP